MKNKKFIVVLIIVIIIAAIIIGVYTFLTSYIFTKDGKIASYSKEDLVKRLYNITDLDERQNAIEIFKYGNFVTQEDIEKYGL